MALSPPRVDPVSRLAAARLHQARALIAERQWDEAVDILRELAEEESSGYVAIDDRRFMPLRTYCHMQLASLPSEGLAAFRRRVDPLAEQWYRRGIAGRDERLLRRVVDELFCSTWGDDALGALAELALERADYAAARRWWQQIHPGLQRSANQDSQWLVYPDSDIEPADVRARLVLVSIRAGDLERASLEIEELRRLYPDAAGRMAGQEAAYVPTLERLLKAAAEWPAVSPAQAWRTFAHSANRANATGPLPKELVPGWEEPVPIGRAGAVHTPVKSQIGPEGERTSAHGIRPNCFPLVLEDLVLFEDALGIHAVRLSTGQPALTSNGLLHGGAPTDGAIGTARVNRLGRINSVAQASPRFSLTATGNILYGHIGRLTAADIERAQRAPGDQIVGLDLERDGLLVFRARPPGAEWSFDGVPVSDGRRVFATLRRDGVLAQANVACFDAATGARQWQTEIGQADTPAAVLGADATHNLLTLVGDRLYFNTNFGLVAAIDTADGRICWLHRYDRHGETISATSLPAHFERVPSPCMYHSGLLVVAPSDAASLFALDAQTGQVVWSNDELASVLHILGVVQDHLLVSGDRLWTLDARSGAVRRSWPDSDQSGLGGRGRGLVAGDEVFWPTAEQIHVFDVRTGAASRPPIDLAGIGRSGANLAAAYGFLIAAGPEAIMAFQPRPQIGNPR